MGFTVWMNQVQNLSLDKVVLPGHFDWNLLHLIRASTNSAGMTRIPVPASVPEIKFVMRRHFFGGGSSPMKERHNGYNKTISVKSLSKQDCEQKVT